MKIAIYTITAPSKIANENGIIHITARTRINWEHNIFKGHFPGNPVLPGVVQIQMITDVVNMIFKKKLTLSNASNIKFINMVVPGNADELTIGLDIKISGISRYDITATLHDRQLTFLKLKGLFSPVETLLPKQKKNHGKRG